MNNKQTTIEWLNRKLDRNTKELETWTGLSTDNMTPEQKEIRDGKLKYYQGEVLYLKLNIELLEGIE